jgi:hypothetical protein
MKSYFWANILRGPLFPIWRSKLSTPYFLKLNFIRMKKLMLSAAILLLTLSITAQPYAPAAENLKARTWFQDAKFGSSIGAFTAC